MSFSKTSGGSGSGFRPKISIDELVRKRKEAGLPIGFKGPGAKPDLIERLPDGTSRPTTNPDILASIVPEWNVRDAEGEDPEEGDE